MKKLYITLLVSFVIGYQASAQWFSLNGPTGGSIQSLEHDGTRLYAGTSEGHLLTGDGDSWEILKTFENAVYTIFRDGDYLWVGTSESTWYLELGEDGSIINAGEIKDISTWHFLKVNDILFLATNEGVYFIKDGEAMSAPNAINSGLPVYSLNATSLAYFDNKLYVTVLGFRDDFSDGRGVYVSSDSGQTWTSDLLIDNGNRVLYVDGNRLYAGTYSGLFFKDADDLDWSMAEGMGDFNGSTDLIKYNNQMFAATFNGLFVSDDGQYWEAYKGNGLTDNILFFDKFNDQLFFGGYGVFKSTNAQDWERVSEGMFSCGVLTFYVDNEALWVGTTNSGIYQYSEGEWADKNNGIENVLLAHSIVKKGEALFASTGMGIRKSSDNGASWSNAQGDLDEFLVPQYLIVNGDLLMAMSSGLGVFISENNGENWVEANEGLTCGRGGCELYNIYKGETGVYVLTGYGVFKFDESTTSWTDITIGALPPSPKWSILEDGERLIVTTQDYGIFYTDNGGESWEEFSVEGIEGIYLAGTSLIKGYNDYYFMIALSYLEEVEEFRTQIYYTSTEEINWQPLMTNFPDLANPNVLAVKGGFIYAGTSTQGVWKLPSQVILSSPHNITLTPIEQNFPNPFSTQTTIRFTAPAKHELVVFDANGTVIHKLKGEHIGRDLYEIKIDMSTNPPAMYYYYLQSESGLSETKKMVLHR